MPLTLSIIGGRLEADNIAVFNGLRERAPRGIAVLATPQAGAAQLVEERRRLRPHPIATETIAA